MEDSHNNNVIEDLYGTFMDVKVTIRGMEIDHVSSFKIQHHILSFSKTLCKIPNRNKIVNQKVGLC